MARSNNDNDTLGRGVANAVDWFCNNLKIEDLVFPQDATLEGHYNSHKNDPIRLAANWTGDADVNKCPSVKFGSDEGAVELCKERLLTVVDNCKLHGLKYSSND
jgi:hypothetical protein